MYPFDCTDNLFAASLKAGCRALCCNISMTKHNISGQYEVGDLKMVQHVLTSLQHYLVIFSTISVMPLADV